MIERRQFLHLAAGTGLALAASAAYSVAQPTSKPLRVLILGGTRFLGIHLTEAALARGHEVTFFNRGRTRAELFPQIKRLVGDRDGVNLGGLTALEGQPFDAVIDTSGYVPRHVRLSAELLAAQAPHYLFISTVSVYQDFKGANDEDATLGRLDDPSVETVDGRTYGPLKALCEQEALRAYADQRCTILRPGLIVGPYDNTDRFTYWPARCAQGGRFIAPGTAQDPIQIIDARDLATYSLACIEQRITGVFNVISAPGQFSMGHLVTRAARLATDIAQPPAAPVPVWLPADFLDQQKILPWSDMPVWVPDTPESFGFSRTSVDRALKTGLQIRSLESTLADTLRWHLNRPQAERAALRAGLKSEREREVLAAWDAAQASQGGS